MNAEYWLTQRTGFYVGVNYESLGDYDQTLGGRTAKIDLGSGTGFRLGLTTRF
jgi:predicted porin